MVVPGCSGTVFVKLAGRPPISAGQDVFVSLIAGLPVPPPAESSKGFGTLIVSSEVELNGGPWLNVGELNGSSANPVMHEPPV